MICVNFNQYIDKLKAEDGVSYLDLLVSIVILFALTAIMLTSTQYINESRATIRKDTTFNQVVHNTVMETYAEDDWNTLVDKEVDVLGGEVLVDYTYEGVSEDYLTHQLAITFTREDVIEEVNLERSVYHVE